VIHCGAARLEGPATDTPDSQTSTRAATIRSSDDSRSVATGASGRLLGNSSPARVARRPLPDQSDEEIDRRDLQEIDRRDLPSARGKPGRLGPVRAFRVDGALRTIRDHSCFPEVSVIAWRGHVDRLHEPPTGYQHTQAVEQEPIIRSEQRAGVAPHLRAAKVRARPLTSASSPRRWPRRQGLRMQM